MSALLKSANVGIDYGHIFRSRDLTGSVFGQLYAIYKQAFPHGARSEEFFPCMMDFNENARLQKQWGDSRYVLTFAREDGQAIAGAAYLIMAAPRKNWTDPDVNVALGMDYRFVAPHAQRRGIATQLEIEARKQAVRFMVDKDHVSHVSDAKDLLLNEASSPPRMPLRAYDEDLHGVGIDPCLRIIDIWGKAGFHRIWPKWWDHSYIETPAKDGPLCDYYNLNAKTPGCASVLARTVIHFITRFAAYRRTEGEHPGLLYPAFAKMLDGMAAFDVLHPTNDAPFLRLLKPKIDRLLGELPQNIPPDLAAQRMSHLLKKRFGHGMSWYARALCAREPVADETSGLWTRGVGRIQAAHSVRQELRYA